MEANNVYDARSSPRWWSSSWRYAYGWWCNAAKCWRSWCRTPPYATTDSEDAATASCADDHAESAADTAANPEVSAYDLGSDGWCSWCWRPSRGCTSSRRFHWS